LQEKTTTAGPRDGIFQKESKMAEQEKKELEIESLEASEVEDADLEEVSGGFTDNNCGCSVKPSKATA
jgi:hypothetical protein